MRDVLGIWISFLCMVHCLLPGLLMLLGLAFGLSHVTHISHDNGHNEWLHFILLVPISLMLLFSLPKAYASHKNNKPIILALSGLTLLVMAVILGHELETPFTLAGSLLVIASHLLNRHTLKRSPLATA